MVKKLGYEDFLSELDKFYTDSKEKNSVYLTFKRLYIENFKFKKNKKNRRLRLQDRLKQNKDTERFNVLVRAKLKKQRIHTVINPDQIKSFHHILTNVLTLHFIRDEQTKKEKKIDIKKGLSKTQKRKIKKLKKIKAKAEAKEKEDKMVVDK